MGKHDRSFTKTTTTSSSTSTSNSTKTGGGGLHVKEKFSMTSDRPLSTTIVICKSMVRVEGVKKINGFSDGIEGTIETDQGTVIIDTQGNFVVTCNQPGLLTIMAMTPEEVEKYRKHLTDAELKRLK